MLIYAPPGEAKVAPVLRQAIRMAHNHDARVRITTNDLNIDVLPTDTPFRAIRRHFKSEGLEAPV